MTYSILPKLMGLVSTHVSEVATMANTRLNVFITRNASNEDWEVRLTAEDFLPQFDGWEPVPTDNDNERWLLSDQILDHILELVTGGVMDSVSEDGSGRRFIRHLKLMTEGLKEDPVDSVSGFQRVICLELSNAELAISLDCQCGAYDEDNNFVIDYSITAVLNLEPETNDEDSEDLETGGPSLSDLIRDKLNEENNS